MILTPGKLYILVAPDQSVETTFQYVELNEILMGATFIFYCRATDREYWVDTEQIESVETNETQNLIRLLNDISRAGEKPQ